MSRWITVCLSEREAQALARALDGPPRMGVRTPQAVLSAEAKIRAELAVEVPPRSAPSPEKRGGCA